MFIELASMLDLVDLVVAGDSMLHVFGLTSEQLVSGLGKSKDYWSPAARYAAQFVRDEVDSPMETRLRMLIVLAGLPEPEVNLKLRDRDGNVVVRLDLAYPHLRLAIEYEGRQHVEIIENWERDIDRGDPDRRRPVAHPQGRRPGHLRRARSDRRASSEGLGGPRCQAARPVRRVAQALSRSSRGRLTYARRRSGGPPAGRARIRSIERSGTRHRADQVLFPAIERIERPGHPASAAAEDDQRSSVSARLRP
jgi:hypothetical protein